MSQETFTARADQFNAVVNDRLGTKMFQISCGKALLFLGMLLFVVGGIMAVSGNSDNTDFDEENCDYGEDCTKDEDNTYVIVLVCGAISFILGMIGLCITGQLEKYYEQVLKEMIHKFNNADYHTGVQWHIDSEINVVETLNNFAQNMARPREHRSQTCQEARTYYLSITSFNLPTQA